MKSLLLISLLAVITNAQTSALSSNDYCYSNFIDGCGPNGIRLDKLNCSAMFSGYSRDTSIGELLSSYVDLNIDYSFRYLLLATNYSTYSHDRPGFEKLYRGLADTAWEDAKNLISYITRRGGEVKFGVTLNENVSTKTNLNLVENLAYAIDMQKEVANSGHKIHQHVSQLGNSFDPDVASYLESNFLHKHSEKLRELSGHMADLVNLFKHNSEHEVRLSVFLFDEYLHSL